MTNENQRKQMNSSELTLVTDVLAKAYTTVGESKATLTDVKNFLKDTNERLRDIDKRLNNLETSVKWVRWILMVGTPILISVLLRLLLP